jgi:hypothetical protein
MRLQLIGTMCVLAAFACGGRVVGESSDAGLKGSSAGSDAEESGAGDAKAGIDAPMSIDAATGGEIACTLDWGGSSSGNSPDGSYEQEMVWTETCSDGHVYTADCYCLSFKAGNCCCATNGAQNDNCGLVGDAGAPYSCQGGFQAGAALTACNFPPISDE